MYYVPTADMAADILTKPLACIKVQHGHELLGISTPAGPKVVVN
jgi:hypothetical protein